MKLYGKSATAQYVKMCNHASEKIDKYLNSYGVNEEDLNEEELNSIMAVMKKSNKVNEIANNVNRTAVRTETIRVIGRNGNKYSVVLGDSKDVKEVTADTINKYLGINICAVNKGHKATGIEER